MWLLFSGDGDFVSLVETLQASRRAMLTVVLYDLDPALEMVAPDEIAASGGQSPRHRLAGNDRYATFPDRGGARPGRASHVAMSALSALRHPAIRRRLMKA